MLAIGQYSYIYIIRIKVMFLKGHYGTCLEFVLETCTFGQRSNRDSAPKALTVFWPFKYAFCPLHGISSSLYLFIKYSYYVYYVPGTFLGA